MIDGNLIQKDGKLCMEVTSFGANIVSKSHQGKKTAWATVTTPDHKPIVVSLGDETEEGLISLQTLEDAIRQIVETVEAALQPKGDF